MIKAQTYHSVNSIKKFSSPLYWQHMSKYATDKDYKIAVDKVKLPVHLVTDERWEPMVRNFVHDEDYRAQLTETVENSIVYKKDRKVAKFADNLQKFRAEESAKQIEEMRKKIEEVDSIIKGLKYVNSLI